MLAEEGQARGGHVVRDGLLATYFGGGDFLVAAGGAGRHGSGWIWWWLQGITGFWT